MNRRTFLRHGALALTAASAGRRASAAVTRPPNFIVVLCDDLGYGDIAAFGAKRVRTPHLDRMVREGTVLTDVGLQAGDILTEVNGVPIDSMATLIALYGRLQGESVIHAQVLRNGQPVSLGVVLR